MKKLSLTYPKSVYNMAQVERAAQDYQGICRVAVTEDSADIICTFSRSIAGLERTALEFSNYLIELANAENTDGSR